MTQIVQVLDSTHFSYTLGQASAEVQGWWSRAQTPEKLDLLRYNDGDFKHHLDRYKYPERFGPADNADAVARMRVMHRSQAVTALLERLEHRLAAQDFLGGTQPCATDFWHFSFCQAVYCCRPRLV